MISLYPLHFVINSLWQKSKSLSYKNHTIDLQSKSMDWFLYDMDLRHERVKKQL